jgi:hypothetical protein
MSSCLDDSLPRISLLFRHVKHAHEFACRIAVVIEHLRSGAQVSLGAAPAIVPLLWTRLSKADPFLSVVAQTQHGRHEAKTENARKLCAKVSGPVVKRGSCTLKRSI